MREANGHAAKTRRGDQMSLARNTLRRTLSLATILVLLIGSAARADVQCSQEALASYGPVNQFAFPEYYVDQGGEALEMCFDINDPLCGAIGPVPDPNAPLDVATGNFLPEAPYSFVTADITLPTGGRRCSSSPSWAPSVTPPATSSTGRRRPSVGCASA